MKKLLISSILGALFCIGCAHPNWVPYSGAQQNWPTSPGAFTDTNRSLIVYYGNPPADYVVLGQISLWSSSGFSGLVARAADEAKLRGADALIVAQTVNVPVSAVLNGQTQFTHGLTFGSPYTAPVTEHDLTAVAIKWKNPASSPTASRKAPAKSAPVTQKNSPSPSDTGHKIVAR